MKAMRGMEARSIAKWRKEGWELVDQSTGTLQTSLTFRKQKPPLPVRQIVIGGAIVLILAVIIGVGALLEGNGNGKDPQSTSSAPVATEQSDSPPTPATTEQSNGPPTQITDTTVDELLDRLNSASKGGIKTGDRFRLTAELFESDAWTTGASGHFGVYLKAKGGADDLLVFANESDADDWHNGTTVEMVVESVQATINGETTDGWLQAQSVKTVPPAS